jgi:hypothetical protein
MLSQHEYARPLKPGNYNGRLGDCKRALAPPVAEFLVNSAGLPVDTEQICKLVMPMALRSGWSEVEVIVVVAMLTKSKDDVGTEVRRRRQKSI